MSDEYESLKASMAFKKAMGELFLYIYEFSLAAGCVAFIIMATDTGDPTMAGLAAVTGVALLWMRTMK